jgi:lysophospholipase L1-like esterase
MLYNPLSVAGAIERLAGREHFTKVDLCSDGELWHSFAHHGSFSSRDAGQMLETINAVLDEGVEALQKADYMIITFGTAWVFRHIDSGMTVANCHKFPAKDFVRERLEVRQIVESFEKIFRTVLSEKRVVLSVSPIRHIKDGLAENSLSKAVLRVAVAELCERCPNVEYFPAYEIMMDELRDYRFYKADMIHPSEQAVGYIAERFMDATVDQDTRELVSKVEKIVTALEHRPMNSETETYTRFHSELETKIEALEKSHPEIVFPDKNR